MSTGIKVAVSIPSIDHWQAGFGFDLAEMSAYVGATLVADQIIDDYVLHMVNGSLLPSSRETLAKRAAKMGASHMLWLDADMRFPKDTLHRLLMHRQPMVAANYVRRGMPVQPVTFKSIDWECTEGPRPKTLCYTTEASTGLEAVDVVGFGCVLMETAVLGKISPPGFLITCDNGRWVGEDANFCRAVKAAGVDIFVDHDLSKEVTHIGSFEYRHAHVDVPEPEKKIITLGDV